MRALSRLMTVGALVAATALTAAPGAVAAPPPAGTCTDPPRGMRPVTEQPWAQQVLDPTSVWPYSRGSGVTVAVVDSGVDDDHPQLRGKVLPGRDFYYDASFPGNFDCASHGTAVASIIAARPAKGVGFAGIAPGAAILPVRVADQETAEDGSLERISYQQLSKGIRFAADSGVDVLNMSLSGGVNSSQIRSAIAYARSKDVLVVASVGNTQQSTGGDALTYPSAYPGVLGVGAVNNNEQISSSSQTGPQVDVVAPGDGVLGAFRVSGHQYYEGTSFAAPFVAATAALVRSAYPKLSADEVAERIMATATPAAGGNNSTAYGEGVVNPYRAVTDRLADEKPGAMPVVKAQQVNKEQVRADAWWSDAGSTATTAALIAGGAAGLVAIVFVVFLLGRRSRWQARRADPLPTDRELDEPPDQVFLLPPPTSER